MPNDDIETELDKQDAELIAETATKKNIPSINVSNIKKIADKYSAPDNNLESSAQFAPLKSSKLNLDLLKRISDKAGKSVPSKALIPAISDKSLSDSSEKDFSNIKYLAKSFGAGASFELAPNELETDKDWLRYSGYASHAFGSLAGGYLGGALVGATAKGIGLTSRLVAAGLDVAEASKAAKSAKLAYNVAKAAGESGVVSAPKIEAAAKAYKAARNVSMALNTGKAVGESAAIGSMVGAAEAVKEGGDFEDIIKNAAGTAKDFAAMAGTLTPIIGAAAARIGNKQITGYSNAVKTALKNDSFVSALRKVKNLSPEISTISLLSNPENISRINNSALKDTAESLFLKPNSPFKSIPESNPDIKNLLDAGEYAKAIDSISGKMSETLKRSKSLSEIVSYPFFNDAESIAKAKTLSVLGSKKFTTQMNNNGIFNVVNDYFLNPNSEAVDTVKALSKSGDLPKRFSNTLKAFNEKDYSNILLNKGAQLELINSKISTALNNIAGKPMSIEQIGSLNDADGIIKGLVTLNSPLLKNTMEIFASKYSPLNNFGVTDTDLIVKQTNGKSINIVGEMAKKQMLLQEVQSKFSRLSKIANALKDPESAASYPELKQSKAALLSEISDKNRNIEVINQRLQSQNPEILKRATETFNEMFIPSNAVQEIGSNKKLYTALFYKDNPVYLKNTGEMAEMLHALSLNGKDIPETWNKFSLYNTERRVGNWLGFQNPIQKYIFDKFKSLEINKDADFKRYMSRIEALKFKPGSRMFNDADISRGSEFSDLIQKFGEKKIDETSEKYLKLSPEKRELLKKSVETFKSSYKELLGRVNNVNAQMNLPLINERQDFFHHIKDINDDWGLIIKNKFLGNDIVTDNFKMYKEQSTDPVLRKTILGAEKMRKGSEYTSDAIGGFEDYLPQILKRIHFQELMRQIDATSHLAPENLGNYLRKFNDEVLNGLKPESTIPAYISKPLDIYRGLAAKSLILGNVSSLVNQVTSAGLSTFWGAKEAMIAPFKMHAMKDVLSQSQNLALRNATSEGYAMDSKDIQSIFKKVSELNLIGGPIKKAGSMRNAWNAFNEKAFSIFDKAAAAHTFTTAYLKGKNAGLEKDAAIRFADWATAKTQHEMTKFGQPEFMNNSVARTAFQFQTFTANLFATLMNDIPQMASRDSTGKAVVQLMKTYAAMSIINEGAKEVGIPEPFDKESFIPGMSTAKFGLSGPIGVPLKYAKALATGKEKDLSNANESFKNMGFALTGIAGTGQIRKTMREMSSEDQEAYAKNDFEKAMIYIFGSKSKKALDKRNIKKDTFLMDLRSK